MGWEEWFDLDLWTCDLKINSDHLFIEGNPCTKFGIDQVKGSKNIERKIQWAEKSDLTLTFDHLTWKSIGIIHSLRATPVISLVLIKWRIKRYWADNTWSTDRQTDIPTDSCKTICPLFQGGHKNGFVIWLFCKVKPLIHTRTLFQNSNMAKYIFEKIILKFV